MDEKLFKKAEEAERRKLAEEVREDYENRRAARRELENKWRLNLNFLSGKQFTGITSAGDVDEEQPSFYWQSRNVFNHILPVYDARLCKLAKIRPVMSVRSATDDNADLKTAELTSKILNATCSRLDADKIISSATAFSEAVGTVFYEVGWNPDAGLEVGFDENGKHVCEGDTYVSVVSPFEIFPDSLSRENVEDCDSIIRARIVKTSRIYEIYGVNVCEETSLFAASAPEKTVERGQVTLIERYEKPSDKYPRGRIVTVAGGELLAVEEFPYENGGEGKRTYPFIKQTSNGLPGCFFGSGVVERLIPVQRAYNAVKNRKTEFLNRISMGVLTVEDGSADVDALIEEGIQPGKVIVYRQGARPPEMMEAESLPSDFEKEEEKLLEEFSTLGGVNEVSKNYKSSLGVTSATGLQLLLEQEDDRLLVSAENIRRAVRETGRHLIRLFRQFTVMPRLMRVAGEGGKAEIVYFSKSDFTSDDVVFETENELSFSPSQRRSSIFDLVKSGLLNNADGTIDENVRNKLLQLLGFSNVGGAVSLKALNVKRAQEENVNADKEELKAEVYDDHRIHIDEHIRFLVGREYVKCGNGDRIKENILRHIAEHESLLSSVPDNADEPQRSE